MGLHELFSSTVSRRWLFRIPLAVVASGLVSCIRPMSDLQNRSLGTKQNGETTVTSTYYIAPSGRDVNNNSGSENSPWKTFNHALNVMRTGDTLIVKDGLYEQQILVNKDNVTIRAERRRAASIMGESGEFYSIVVAADNVTLQGLKVDYASSHRNPGNRNNRIDIQGNRCIIRDCEIIQTDKPYDGALFGRSKDGGIRFMGDGLEVDSCEIYRCTFGVMIRGGRNYHVHDCHIHHTIQNCIDINGQTRNGLIEHNLLESSLGEDAIQTNVDYSLANLTSEATNRRIIIRNNVLRNCPENCIDTKGGGDIVIESNFIYGFAGDHGGGYEPQGHNTNAFHPLNHGNYSGRSSRSPHLIVRNNVIYDNAGGIGGFEEDTKIYNNVVMFGNRTWEGSNLSQPQNPSSKPNMTSWFHRDNFFPNIGFVNNICGGNSQAVVAIGKPTSDATVHIDSNLYFGNRGKTDKFCIEDSNYLYMNFSEWRSRLQGYGSRVSGCDADSILVASLDAVGFSDVEDNPTGNHEKYDFTLSSSSPAYRAGAPLTEVTVAVSASNSVSVRDATWFCDGYGVTSGDTITIGSTTVRITQISGNTLSLSSPVTATRGTPVYFGESDRPNIGLAEVTHRLTSDFAVSPMCGAWVAPQTIQFEDRSVATQGRQIYRWRWEYQRGEDEWVEFSTAQNPNLPLTIPGAYSFRLTVWESDSTTSSTSTRRDCIQLTDTYFIQGFDPFRKSLRVGTILGMP